MLNPLEETINVTKQSKKTITLDNFKGFNFVLIIFFASTIIKLETALIIVSMLLIANEIDKNINIPEMYKFCFCNIR